MSSTQVNIRELAPWGFDDAARGILDPHSADLKSFLEQAYRVVAERPAFNTAEAILQEMTESEQTRFAHLCARDDIQREYAGLRWTIAVVDLRKLIAFQRRILLTPDRHQVSIASAEKRNVLLQLAFDRKRSTVTHCQQRKIADGVEEFLLRSWNPDLQLRVDASAKDPVQIYGGSPFFEVAHYRGRWFLRDGYHRAYALLQAGIHAMFAIVVDARNMAEVGAVQPWFFDEQVLFSERPPMVTDFHKEALVLSYSRARMIKRITLRVEETLLAADENDYRAMSPTGEAR